MTFLEKYLARWASVVGRALHHVAQYMGDAACGMGERLRPAAWGPSGRAWREALAYYATHEQEGPDPMAFGRLIRRNRLPDWANPFPEGQEEHYHCHPLGLLAADVELVLEAWFMDPEPEPEEDAVPLATWPTLLESHRHERRERRLQRVQEQARARVCWAMAVSSGGISRLRSVLHADNLVAATADVVLRGNLKQWGLSPPKVWRVAVRQGLVPNRPVEEVWAMLKGPHLPSAPG